MKELFRSENLLVRCMPTADESRWVVTFDNYGLGPGFDREGFGETFLSGYGISAIHVLGRGDDWYQYPEIAQALESVRAGTQAARRVMTYGSSMGAYSAVRFADAVGATSTLALSPQYSLDPAKAPDEDRWVQDARRIKWLPEVDGPIRCSFKPVIIYDPVGPDGWHGRRIADDIEVSAVLLPHTAHPVAVYLDEVGLLKELVMDGLEGTLDVRAFQQEALRRRRNSANYFGELALRQPPGRPRTALALAHRAVELGPANGHALTGLARILRTQRAYPQALAVHRQLVEVSGRKHDYLIPYGDTLALSGDLTAAADVAREVLATMPHLARFQAWAAQIFWMGGAKEEALKAARNAMALDPDDPRHLNTFATYQAEAMAPRIGAEPPRFVVRALRWALSMWRSLRQRHSRRSTESSR